MKCPNCGATITSNTGICDFCGSQISFEMKREQEQLNKSGCPKCGSTNISFSRETQGERQGKKGTTIVYTTVGLCNDCGYTWKAADATGAPQKTRKTWLWVLGWIFIFPLPLTILLVRNKKLPVAARIVIILAAWLLYAFWARLY